jgi:uncharacterized protein YciI
MFIVILKFLDQGKASALMASHKAWLDQGFNDGVFLLSGTLADKSGGVVVARGATRAALESRVVADPFVAEGVVRADVIEIVPGRVTEQLSFLGG